MADFSPTLEQEAVKETAVLINDEPIGTWTLHTDGASNIRGTGLGVVLKSPQGDNIAQAVRCEWDATNNEAEYEALIFGLHLAIDIGVRDISVTCDSLLIVNQIQGSFAAKDDGMIAYLEVAKDLVTKFDKFDIQQVPREQNTQADALANLGSALDPK